MEEIGKQLITGCVVTNAITEGKLHSEGRNEPQKEGLGGHFRQKKCKSKVLDSGKNVIWGNVKRFRVFRKGSERSLKILFYEMRNLILENLSEMATAIMNEKEVGFPSYFKKLTRVHLN